MSEIEQIIAYLKKRADEIEDFAFTPKGEQEGRDLNLGEAEGYRNAAHEIGLGKWKTDAQKA